MPSIPEDQSNIDGFNTIRAGGVNYNGGAVKSGGTTTGIDAIPIYSPSEMDGSSDRIDEAFLAASGDTATTIDGTTNFVPVAATHIRKGIEENMATTIDKPYGATNRILAGTEVETSGLTLLRDGRYVDSGGVIWAHPTGIWTDDHERINNSGDYGAKMRNEYGTDFHVRESSLSARKTLPSRTS